MKAAARQILPRSAQPLPGSVAGRSLFLVVKPLI
jgi:hypothetical protein